MPDKRLTLDQIAQLAGVSRATVSRVVNNYPHIRAEIRERVEAIIHETGYHPNLIARSLASDRSGIIGLVIPNTPRMVFTDPYFSVLINGITQATNRTNLTLALFMFHSDEEEQRTIQSILNTGLLDGVIITADRREKSLVMQFVHKRVPFVLIGRPEMYPEISYVDTDNLAGAAMGVEHLIKLGHRRIALIGSGENTAGDDRTAGYYRALQNHGLAVEPALITRGDFSLESGYKAMRQILPHQPDAVFIASDTMALGALNAIRESGLRVPDDIALVSFDDLPPAVQADPPLTTVRQPVEKMGFLAVEMLIKILARTDALHEQHIVPSTLVIRASCGAVKSGFIDNEREEGA